MVQQLTVTEPTNFALKIHEAPENLTLLVDSFWISEGILNVIFVETTDDTIYEFHRSKVAQSIGIDIITYDKHGKEINPTFYKVEVGVELTELTSYVKLTKKHIAFTVFYESTDAIES